jgi:hypothetical protein
MNGEATTQTLDFSVSGQTASVLILTLAFFCLGAVSINWWFVGFGFSLAFVATTAAVVYLG